MGDTCSLGSLSDERLLQGFGVLVRQDRGHTAELLRYIAEIDERKLWAKQAHPSMFDFCVVRFHMSEPTAGKRIGAARTARRFPVLFDMVARGEIHLSGILRLAAHLTDENHRQVLAEAKHKTVKELERLVARLAPKPDVPSRVRALPRCPSAGSAAGPEPTLFTRDAAAPAAPTEPTLLPRADGGPAVPAEPSQPAGPPPRAPDPKPLSPRRYELRCTFGEEANRKLERLQGLLAHKIPDGDPAKIVELGFDALLERTLKRKAATTDRPRASASTPPASSGRSRAIPAHVRREVFDRDDGRCGFIGDDGRRCNETRALEFAHLKPRAKGGKHTVDNIGLRCRAHNAHEADRDYGPLFMARKREEACGVRETFAPYAPAARAPAARHDRTAGVYDTCAAHVGVFSAWRAQT